MLATERRLTVETVTSRMKVVSTREHLLHYLSKRTNVTMVFILFILAHWLALKYGLSEWQKDGGTCTVHNGLIVATIDDDGGNNDQDDDDTWCTRRPWSVMEWRARTTKTSTLIDKNCW